RSTSSPPPCTGSTHRAPRRCPPPAANPTRTWSSACVKWARLPRRKTGPIRRRSRARALQLHVLVGDGLRVDAAVRRRDPPGHLARLRHALLQALDEGDVLRGRQPLVLLRLEFGGRDRLALRVRVQAGPGTDAAAKACRRQLEL